MTADVLLPLLSSLVAAVLAVFVFGQYAARRRPFQLAWALGLVWYCLSTATEFAGGAFGWGPALYRAWYITGALFVAAYLGAGTVYLLTRTHFGYFAALSVLLGGLISLAIGSAHAGAMAAGLTVLLLSILAAALLVAVTAWRRRYTGHMFMALLVVASIAGAWIVLRAPLSAPGYALDPVTQVVVGTAFPGYVRVISGPFNVGGGMSLVFGALFSFYVYMPKHVVAGPRRLPPVVAQGYAFLAALVNAVASLPRAAADLFAGRLNSRVPATFLIALGGLVPAVTSGLSRLGVTWGFYLGQLVGILLILGGLMISEEVVQSVRAQRWLRRPDPRADLQ